MASRSRCCGPPSSITCKSTRSSQGTHSRISVPAFGGPFPLGNSGGMALTNRYKSAPGAGTIAALILVLVFGSPWYADWAADNTNPNTAGGWWLRLLAWPHWQFDSDDSLRSILIGDLKAILVVVLTLVFL